MGMEKAVGLGNSADIWRGAIGQVPDISLPGSAGRTRRGPNTTTFQKKGDEQGDKGAWMSVWVENVDDVYKECLAAGVEITFPPHDMPWETREMHLRHLTATCFASVAALKKRVRAVTASGDDDPFNLQRF